MSYRYGRPVAELQEQISSDHFTELLAEELIEPRGERRNDLRMGISAALLANCHRGKHTAAFKPSDFIPEFGKPREKPKPFNRMALRDQLKAMAMRSKR